MATFTRLTSRAVPLPFDDIDTDQIIPARFLKSTDKAGLGAALFSDWRYTSEGTPRAEFVLNRPESRGAGILLAGGHFGCGSSREHAPWALIDFGFRAVISTSFADIFRTNALKNGLLPVVVDAQTHRELFNLVEQDPSAELTIDLPTQSLSMPNGKTVGFSIDGFSKTCLLHGMDELGYLMSHADRIKEYERRNETTLTPS